MTAAAPWRACACLALLLFAAMGCQQAVLPQAELRAGLSEEAVINIVGRKPESVEQFTLKERPGERYAVLEYHLAQTRASPERRHWFLFDRTGLIGYGRGGHRAARSLAYDLFYQWMADHQLMLRAEAEQAYLQQLRAIYGNLINPLVAEYVGIRAMVMARVDDKKLSLAQAEAVIRSAFADRLGSTQRAAIYGGIAAPMGRYATLIRIGLDVGQSSTIAGKNTVKQPGMVMCRQIRATEAARLRCF